MLKLGWPIYEAADDLANWFHNRGVEEKRLQHMLAREHAPLTIPEDLEPEPDGVEGNRSETGIRGKNAVALLSLLSKSHGYELPNSQLRNITPVMVVASISA
jgi:hypothetical protein